MGHLISGQPFLSIVKLSPWKQIHFLGFLGSIKKGPWKFCKIVAFLASHVMSGCPKLEQLTVSPSEVQTFTELDWTSNPCHRNHTAFVGLKVHLFLMHLLKEMYPRLVHILDQNYLLSGWRMMVLEVVTLTKFQKKNTCETLSFSQLPCLFTFFELNRVFSRQKLLKQTA